jgi:hypothetical protein
MSGTVTESVHQWLDEAATAMGGDPRRRSDVLLELETTIYDRLEERTGGETPTTKDVKEVLTAMGEPAEVANSFMPVQPLLAPHQTRPFLLNVAALFAVHMLFVIGATVAGGEFGFTSFRISPISNPGNALEVFARALGTLMFDIGLMLCVFAILPRVHRVFRFPRTSLIVRPKARRSVELACFLTLALVVVDFFRHDLLALYLPSAEGTLVIPFVGQGIETNLFLLNLWLVSAIVRELLYARFGESRSTLVLDVASNAIGLACLLRMVASRDLVDLTGATDVLGSTAETLGPLLNTSFMLLAVLTAALLAARLVFRGFRLMMVRSTG